MEEPIKLTRQQIRVLEYIAEFGSITSLEGQRDLGILDIPKRVSELRKLGYGILGKHIPVRNRYGETTTVVQYYFDKGEREEYLS